MNKTERIRMVRAAAQSMDMPPANTRHIRFLNYVMCVILGGAIGFCLACIL